jgi:hypothetical protein
MVAHSVSYGLKDAITSKAPEGRHKAMGGAMPQAVLLIEVFVVWFLALFAAASRLALEDARRGIPEDHRRGVSFFPFVIPLLPLGFWGIAMVIDIAVNPWGTIVVGGLHAALGVLYLAYIVYYGWQIWSIE